MPCNLLFLRTQLEFQSNFLDLLSDDLPKGCWAVRQETMLDGAHLSWRSPPHSTTARSQKKVLWSPYAHCSCLRPPSSNLFGKQFSGADTVVTVVKSLRMWPGYSAFHVPGTGKRLAQRRV